MGVRIVSARVRRLLYGNRRVVIWAAAFVALGLIVIPVVIMSSIQWTGTAVPGTERGGVVYYTFHETHYTIDDTSDYNTTTVYLDPAHPDSGAALGNTYGQVVDAAVMATPFLTAVIILAVGIRRREVIGSADSSEFGHGLDPLRLRRMNYDRRADGKGL